MATINHVSGKSYRVCTDADNDVYDELSFETDASDVNFTDGTDAESSLGQIKGITSDVTGEAEDIAASIKVVNNINRSLGGMSFYEDETGKYIVGADSVPKKLGSCSAYEIYFKASATIITSSDSAHNVTAELVDNNNTVISVSVRNTFYQDFNVYTETSNIYHIDETGQDLYIIVTMSTANDSSRTVNYSATLYINDVKIKTISGSCAYNRESSVTTGNFNITGYGL